MTLLFVSNLGFAWGDSGAAGGGGTGNMLLTGVGQLALITVNVWKIFFSMFLLG